MADETRDDSDRNEFAEVERNTDKTAEVAGQFADPDGVKHANQVAEVARQTPDPLAAIRPAHPPLDPSPEAIAEARRRDEAGQAARKAKDVLPFVDPVCQRADCTHEDHRIAGNCKGPAIDPAHNRAIWNDVVNPFDADWGPVAGMTDYVWQMRYVAANPRDHQGRLTLVDIADDMGDADGAAFWRFMCVTGRRPDYYNTFWWWDNNLLKPSESPFRIPVPMLMLFQAGLVRYPAPAPGYEAASWWEKTLPGRGEKIEMLGFDGRICAETTLLQAWRLMTADERAAALAGDFDFADPARKPATA